MILIGAFVDGLASSLGGVLGCLFKKRVSRKFGDFLLVAIGLCLVMAGVQGMTSSLALLLTTLEMVIGAGIGYKLDIDGHIKRAGDYLQRHISCRFAKGESNTDFTDGFVNATLFICVGSMAIVGSLQAGLLGDNAIFYAKALIDGVTTILFAATFGAGVILSGVVVFIYQAILTLGASQLSVYLSDAVIQEMVCVGSLLLFALGLDLIKIKSIKIANLLPACFLPIVMVPIYQFLSAL